MCVFTYVCLDLYAETIQPANGQFCAGWQVGLGQRGRLVY